MSIPQNILALCQNRDGGFGGGPGQMSHLATTYAAMNALTIVGTGGFVEAYKIINRPGRITFINYIIDYTLPLAMLSWLRKVKSESGCFSMHINGEEDTRAAYCACCVAAMLKIDLDSELFQGTVQYLINCQNWDGGFGPSKFLLDNYSGILIHV